MNGHERAIRNQAILDGYARGQTPKQLMRDFRMSEAHMYLILRARPTTIRSTRPSDSGTSDFQPIRLDAATLAEIAAAKREAPACPPFKGRVEF